MPVLIVCFNHGYCIVLQYEGYATWRHCGSSSSSSSSSSRGSGWVKTERIHISQHKRPSCLYWRFRIQAKTTMPFSTEPIYYIELFLHYEKYPDLPYPWIDEQMDKDGSGTISFEEFESVLASQADLSRGDILVWFLCTTCLCVYFFILCVVFCFI